MIRNRYNRIAQIGGQQSHPRIQQPPLIKMKCTGAAICFLYIYTEYKEWVNVGKNNHIQLFYLAQSSDKLSNSNLN